jgi:hypothetical protein
MNFGSKIGRYKRVDLAVYGLIFLLLFFIGIMGGRRIGKYKLFHNIQESFSANRTESTFGSGQHNYLVIGTDDINSSDPILESIWLLIAFPGRSNLTMIPIYPTIENGIPLADSSLSQLFEISAQGIPETTFLGRLQEQIHWDYYVVIDKVGFSDLVKFLSHPDSDSNNSSILASLPLAWEDPAGALSGQTKLLMQVCAQTSNLSAQIQTIELIKKNQSHFQTDIDWEETLSQWSIEDSNLSRIDCEFPSSVLDIQ